MLRLAWRNIWRNKRRTLLHTGIIAFAVVVSCYVRSMQKGIYENLVLTVAGMHTGYLQVIPQMQDSLAAGLDRSFAPDPALLERLSHTAGIAGVAPRLEAPALASSGEISRGAFIMGFDPAWEEKVTAPQQKVVSGRMPAADEMAALLPADLARLLHLKVGDTLLLAGEGYQAQPAYGKYPITGLLHLHSPDLDRRLVYLTLPAAQDFFRTEGRITSFALTIRNPRGLEAATLATQAQLKGTQLSVQTWKEMMPGVRTAIQADEIGNRIMVSILYLIITLGISGTLVMMALERKFEMGVMIAVGMRRGRLAGLLLTEGVLLALLGIALGLAIAVPLVLWFHSHPIPMSGSMAEGIRAFGVEPVITFSTDPFTFLAQALTVLLITLLLGVLPLRILYRIQPVRALREGR
jgi:ABC-type lipoprotein release transport system permease subunit